MKYRVDGPGLFEEFHQAIHSNTERVAAEFGREIQLIERSLELQYKIASHFVWMLDSVHAPRAESERTAFRLFHKNFFAFYGSLDLARRGLLGPARTLLRHIFESLVIAKFCAISEDESVSEKWETGKVIYLTKEVLKKIEQPTIEPISRFWGVLSDYSHASIQSQQLGLDVTEEEHWAELDLTFVYMQILLECSYHLLNSHLITRSMAYYAEYFCPTYTVPALRTEARAIFGAWSHRFAREARRVTATYKRRWEIKQSGAPPRTRYTFRNRIAFLGE